MSVLATINAGEALSQEVDNACKVVILSEDAFAQSKAMEICSRLETGLDREPVLAFDCWRFNDLADSSSARRATEAAADADILLFSTHGNDLSLGARVLLESCARLRAKTEGALAVLITEPFSSSAAINALLARLEHAASRLHMDILSLVPPSAENVIEEIKQRANTVTSLLNQILNQPHYAHGGLNE
jgi:hypothetical protein